VKVRLNFLAGYQDPRAVEVPDDTPEDRQLKMALESEVRHRARLNGIDLGRAYLCEANLGSAYLSNAHLYGAYLGGADMGHTDLSHADLRRAYLSNAYLYCANLKRANLSEGCLYNANLDNADLSYANLRHANLSHTGLNNTDLKCADLSRATLYGARLGDANLTGAYLDGKGIAALVTRVTRTIDSYEFRGWLMEDGSIRIDAGVCRHGHSPDSYRQHVADKYAGSPKAAETLRIIDFIEASAKAMGAKT
jgi:hypothetical protein